MVYTCGYTVQKVNRYYNKTLAIVDCNAKCDWTYIGRSAPVIQASDFNISRFQRGSFSRLSWHVEKPKTVPRKRSRLYPGRPGD
jgi:hypothetical protein